MDSTDRTDRPSEPPDGWPVLALPAAATDLLGAARASRAGRSAHTFIPGAGAPLKQTLLALVAGESLAEHDSPGAATLQVITGVVRLAGGGQELVLRAGDLAGIPRMRHALDAVEDAVVLVSVGSPGG